MTFLKNKTLLLGIALGLFSAWAHFYRLGTGAPGADKNLRLFSSLALLEALAPEMNDLRNRHYAVLDDMLNPEKSFKENYDKLFGADENNRPLGVIAREIVLGRMRGYVIGVRNSDEQNTMLALSRLNPFRLKFNPGVDTFYGGFYYYTCGAVLFAGKLLGLVSLNPDLLYYYAHPEQTMRMYALIRSLGALSVLLTLAGVLFWTDRRFGLGTAALAALFFAFTPLLVPYSHMAKAHNYGMLLFFAGTLLALRSLEGGGFKSLAWGALLLGASAGSIITNLTVGIVLFFVEWARSDWKIGPVLKSRSFWAASFLFFAVYLASNFYIYADWARFQRTLMALREYMSGYGETYGALNLKNWVPFLRDMFSNQMHWAVLPFLALGTVQALRSDNKILKVLAAVFLFLTLLNLLFTRHPGVNIRIFPLAAILCALGARSFMSETLGSARRLGAALVVLALLLSGLQTCFNLSLLREPDNLAQAGDWINGNVPKGASVGVMRGQISQTAFPPIRFLDYAMVHFPDKSLGLFPVREKLPEYVVCNDTDHPLLETDYDLVKDWRARRSFLGIPFARQWVISGDVDVFILRKKSA